jgi:hypothetical protein
VTRHPRKGAAEQLPVSARELVESRAAKKKIPPCRVLRGNGKLSQTNLLKKEQCEICRCGCMERGRPVKDLLR